MTASITEKLDEMLKDDKTFTTRSGLRFMAELVRDAFQYIEDEKEQNKNDGKRIEALEIKFSELDKSLAAFLKVKEGEQKKAEEERTRWRWAFLTPSIALILTELVRWYFGK